jgi:hypothetical protein
MNNENWKGHTRHQLWSERYDPAPHLWFEEKKDLIRFTKFDLVIYIVFVAALCALTGLRML